MKKFISICVCFNILLFLLSGCDLIQLEYGKVTKVGDKLYEVTFDKYVDNYVSANEFYKNEYFINSGDSTQCSCIYKDGIFMRNLDWYIKQNGVDICETVIRTTANEGRYATIGVMNNSMVTDETYDKLSKKELEMLPFILTDGMNSEGLMFGQNSCPAVDEISVTYGTNPLGEDLVSLMVGRVILDYCASVDEAIELLKSRNCYTLGLGEMHFLLADDEKAVVIEFVDNSIVVIEQEDLPNQQTFCTNHYLFNGGIDTGHGAGFERDKIIRENYDSITDWKSGMDLLEKLKYSNIYTIPFGDDFWYSEFHEKVEYGGNIYDFNSDTPNDDPLFLRLIGIQIEAYERFDDDCWRTSHSSVYDSFNRVLHLSIREDYDKIYNFSF